MQPAEVGGASSLGTLEQAPPALLLCQVRLQDEVRPRTMYTGLTGNHVQVQDPFLSRLFLSESGQRYIASETRYGSLLRGDALRV